MNDSLILRTAVRFLVPMLLVLSVMVLLRGHNEPGGGFVGGLLAAGAALWALVSLAMSFFGAGPQDWVWLVMALIALAGVQLASVAIVGGCVIRVARQAEPHPLYVVRDVTGFAEEPSDEPSDEAPRSGYVVYT